VARPIRLENLSRHWGAFGLQGIDLEVEGGDYFVLLGPIASGKTLLLETVAGLHPPESGRVSIGGTDVTEAVPERRGIGFVYQQSMLFPHLNVLENIRFGLRFASIEDREKQARVDEVVELLDLKALLERQTTNLSGGERQKVALARALAVKPQVLLLDEPLSPLDNLTKEALRDQLRDVHRELGTTTIEVTHDQLSARATADHVGILNDGRLLQVGRMEEVFARPSCRFIAEFLGAENVFSGRASREGELSRIALDCGIELLAETELEGKVGLCIRPEEVRVAGKGAPEGQNAFAGRLTDISDRGPMIRLATDISTARIRALVTRPEFAELGCNVGDELRVSLPSGQVWVFREESPLDAG